MLDKREMRAFEALEHAEEGNGITDDEIRLLFDQPMDGNIAYAMRATAFRLARRATDGIADVHAQVDMDGSSCPRDCKFCSLAQSNTGRIEKVEMPRDEVLRNVERFLDAGVNLIGLMVTAAYDFEKYVDISAEAIAMIPDDIPVVANLDDFSLEQAKILKEIGFCSAYHAIHWGEGVITNIPKERRFQTFENCRKAGLTVASGVEPIAPDATGDEVVAAFRETLEQAQPVSMCSIWRYPVAGSPFASHKPVARHEFAFIVALNRLILGTRVPYTGAFGFCSDSGSNWGVAEVGMNPRDTETRTEDSGVAGHVESERKAFEENGWEIRKGGAPGWWVGGNDAR